MTLRGISQSVEQTPVPERQVGDPASGEACKYKKLRAYPTYMKAPSHNIAPNVAFGPQKAQKDQNSTGSP